MTKIKMAGLATLFLLVLSVVGGTIYVNSLFSSSLPMIDGQIKVSAIKSETVIARDASGSVKITGANPLDVYFALGFAHGQDRFFMMDLARRSVSGRLSELFGQAYVDYDSRLRVHQFQQKSKLAVTRLTGKKLAILNAYVNGVNQGLKSLPEIPFEYQVLSVKPEPWQASDSFKVILSMYLSLQERDGSSEYHRFLAQQSFTEPVLDFIFPRGTPVDAAIDGSVIEMTDVPELVQLTDQKEVFKTEQEPEQEPETKTENTLTEGEPLTSLFLNQFGQEQVFGSNNWAVSGHLTKDGRAILADDMHLSLGVPNIWYRTELNIIGTEQDIHQYGVSLPGVPGIVVGSNQKVSWGFTNSYGDWHDLKPLKINPNNPEEYWFEDTYIPFEKHAELIQVKDQSEAVTKEVLVSKFGPVVRQDKDRAYAYQWVAHDEQGINMDLIDINYAETIEQAMDAANGAGMPAQNMLVVDNQGSIGWTIAGAIPKRHSDGYFASQDSVSSWNEYYQDSDYPRMINPESGRIWTANSRVVGGDALAKIGDGGYASPHRSHQIRQSLFEKEQFDEKDLLAIQLDDRALYLRPWVLLMMQSIEKMDETIKDDILEVLNQWDGRATPGSHGYYLVKRFRKLVSQQVFESINKSVKHPEFKYNYATRQWEQVVLKVIHARKKSWLPEKYKSYEALVQQSIHQAWQSSEFGQKAFSGTVKIGHPFAFSIPLANLWLALPESQAPGDIAMPRVGGRSFGASQRMVVSPGNEQEAIFHMPAGQVGNPNSIFWGSGHEEWLVGKSTPLKIKNTQYQLTLEPEVSHE